VRVPFEGHRWICQSFPYPNEEEQDGFDGLICNLAHANVRVILWRTPNRILVFTWVEPQTA
jgi:hypothetical protein